MVLEWIQKWKQRAEGTKRILKNFQPTFSSFGILIPLTVARWDAKWKTWDSKEIYIHVGREHLYVGKTRFFNGVGKQLALTRMKGSDASDSELQASYSWAYFMDVSVTFNQNRLQKMCSRHYEAIHSLAQLAWDLKRDYICSFLKQDGRLNVSWCYFFLVFDLLDKQVFALEISMARVLWYFGRTFGSQQGTADGSNLQSDGDAWMTDYWHTRSRKGRFAIENADDEGFCDILVPLFRKLSLTKIGQRNPIRGSAFKVKDLKFPFDNFRIYLHGPHFLSGMYTHSPLHLMMGF